MEKEEALKIAEQQIKTALEYLMAETRKLVRNGYVSIEAEANSNESFISKEIQPTEINIKLYIHPKPLEFGGGSYDESPNIVEAIMSLGSKIEHNVSE